MRGAKEREEGEGYERWSCSLYSVEWEVNVVLVELSRGATYRCGMRLVGRELCLVSLSMLVGETTIQLIKTSRKRVNHIK